MGKAKGISLPSLSKAKKAKKNLLAKMKGKKKLDFNKMAAGKE